MIKLNKAFAATLAVTLGISSIFTPMISHTSYVHAAVSESRKGTDFADMTYEHFDLEAFNKEIKSLEKLLKKNGNEKKVIRTYSSLLNAYYDIIGNVGQAFVYNSQNVVDPYYISELQYSNSTLMKVSDALISITKKVTSSSYQKAVEQKLSSNLLYQMLKKEDKTLTKKQHELNNKESKLITDYNALTSKEFTTTVSGTSFTLSQLSAAKDLTQEQIAAATQKIRTKQNRAYGNVYVNLIKVRQELAKSYGYDNYTDYCYKASYARDFSAKESETFCNAVKKDIVPLTTELWSKINLNAAMKANMHLGHMDSNAIMNAMKPYLSQISPSLKTAFNFMNKYHLCSLDPSDVKSPVSYTKYLTKYKEPYISIAPYGSYYDITNFIHEFGHFHSFYVNDKEAGLSQNLDLQEIHSQGLELLYTKYYDSIFGKDCGSDITTILITLKLQSIVEGCMFDEFQREVYSLTNPTLKDVNDLYTKACKEYGLIPEDSTEVQYGWMDVYHNFQLPLYYISYAVSAAPSLEIWLDSLTDYSKACKTYLKVVKRGTRYSYTQTLNYCHLTSPFEEGYCERLNKELRKNLGL